MADRGSDKPEEEIVNELDSVLPGEIDRRKFLHGSVSAIGAAMLAGCSGDGGDGGAEGGGGTGGSQDTPTDADTDTEETTDNGEETSNQFSDDTQAAFSTPWKMEPSWGPVHVAAGQGYFEDAGVPNINATRGNGSDTEAQNVGTGNKEIGISSMATALSVYPETQDTEALDMTIMGLARGRPLLSLIWRKDEMESRDDIAGKTILAASGFAAATSGVYPSLVDVDPSEVTFEEGTEEVAAPRLANNEVQAIWGSIDLLPTYQEEVDAELGVTPLTAFGAFPGFPIWVNSSWFEQKENNVEFMAQVMTGYFKALKWCLLNQDEYLQYLQNEVNPNLQTWTEDELAGQHEVLCAQAVTLNMKDEGLGYFTEEDVSFVLENAASSLVDNPDALPSVSELVDRRAYEQSEKVTFTDEEWNQLSETAGQIWTLFEEAESGN